MLQKGILWSAATLAVALVVLASLVGGGTKASATTPADLGAGTATGTLTGRVFLDSNRTGTWEAGDWFIEWPGTGCLGRQLPLNVTVTWSGPASGFAAPDVCNPDALYVSNLSAGVYNVSISLPPGWDSTSSSPLQVTVTGGGVGAAWFGIAPSGSDGTGVVRMNASVTVSIVGSWPSFAYPFPIPSSFNFVGLAGSVVLSTASQNLAESLITFWVNDQGSCPAYGAALGDLSNIGKLYPSAVPQSVFILKSSAPGNVTIPSEFVFPVKVPDQGCIFVVLTGAEPALGDPVTMTSNMYLLYDQGSPPIPSPFFLSSQKTWYSLGGEVCYDRTGCEGTSLNTTRADAFAIALPITTPLRLWSLTGDVSAGAFTDDPFVPSGPWYSTFDFFVYPSCPPPPEGVSGPMDYYSQIPSGARPILSFNLTATGKSSVQAAVASRLAGDTLSPGECVVELLGTVLSSGGVTQESQVLVLVQPPSAPSAPGGLAATFHDSHVSLTWRTPSSNGGSPITGYNIYRGPLSGGEAFLASVGDVLDYSDASAANGSTYFYQVSAVNALGEGLPSNEANATVPAQLQAAISASPITGTAPLTVSFTGTAAGGVAPYAYEWAFGDGSTSAVQNPSRTYSTAGNYTVRLTVTDEDGQAAMKTIQITVNGPNALPAPPAGTALIATCAVVAIAVVGVVGAVLWRWRKVRRR